MIQIEHLNTATMHPRGGGRWDGSERGVFDRAHLVAHCLLLALDTGEYALVDTGLGRNGAAEPHTWLGGVWTGLFHPTLDETQTAAAQLEARGINPSQVSTVITTHLDADHSGGLADFPDATVLVHGAELYAWKNPGFVERRRYRDSHFGHTPKFQPVLQTGDTWMGLPAIRNISGLPPQIVIVPLPGHSPGHVGVAVERPDGSWLLHAGDSYFFHGEIDADPTCPLYMNLFRHFTAVDPAARKQTLAELQRLRGHVDIVNSHDLHEFERVTSGTSPDLALAETA
ncbi:MBL fold metallo-hydrolase [Nocardia tengchongensis]|uniref:MBL fold metallo-hydrolase n=1 Tax=Nocardia tengchongensis TaxID=2055889 RepID=UPI00364ECEC2